MNKITVIYSLSFNIISVYYPIFCYKNHSGDNYIFLIVTMLVSIGVIMIYRIDPELGLKQILWIGMGISTILYYLLYLKRLKDGKIGLCYMELVPLLLFLLTLLFGKNIKGAINWIAIGPFSYSTF